MSTTVSYKGNTIATVENNTKTLKTAGKYMEGDVVLSDESGGASNVVYGTFTTSSTSTTQIISIPYTGNGYPIIATIEVDGGVGAWLSNTFPNRIIGRHSISKQGWSSTPNYNGTTGILNVLHTARNGEIMDQYSNQGTMFAQTVDGGINPYNNITFISKNEMKIWISAQDGTNYGLKPSTDYIYTIVYSS